MRNYNFLKLALLILMLVNTNLWSQTTDLQNIALAIKNADTKNIYDNCQEVVSLSIPDVNGKFSKAQARQILLSFFKKHPAVVVKTLKSEKHIKGNTYSIIEYRSQNKNYHIFIQYKKDKNTFLIQTIQIQELKP